MNATRSISVCWCLLDLFLCSLKFRGFFFFQGFSFCHLRGWRVLRNLSWSSVQILVSVKVCCNLGQNSASGSPSQAEMQTNRIFYIDLQILQRNGCLSELPLCCSWGSGGWKNELCVHKAAGTRVSPKCLCLGICKAINASFFLLQLLETPIFSIDFTQNAYCPWRCDLYLRLIYFCHGCSIF